MNRTHDLKVVLPSVIDAANESPPVEIVILDYNSQDDLATYMGKVLTRPNLVDGNFITYRKYTGRDHFHMAHARNLAVLASRGDYIYISCADIKLKPSMVKIIRAELEKGYTWLHHSDRFVGNICISRQEFIDAGGYDERFEFYGKEDKDLLQRLRRRGAPHAQIPDRLTLIYTPWPEKLRNYRLPLSRKQMSKRSKAIYQENMEAGVLVANEGKEWGQWA
jgi:hypothetical protein